MPQVKSKFHSFSNSASESDWAVALRSERSSRRTCDTASDDLRMVWTGVTGVTDGVSSVSTVSPEEERRWCGVLIEELRASTRVDRMPVLQGDVSKVLMSQCLVVVSEGEGADCAPGG